MTSQPAGTVPHPRIMALFQKRIDGDDALLRLASRRFREARIGTEYYAGNPDQLEWLLGFSPFDGAPAVVHLPRGIDLFRKESREFIVDFAMHFRSRIYGLIVHDQKDIPDRFDDYADLLAEIEHSLMKITDSPFLLVEYAAGLERALFITLFKKVRNLKKVSCCIDIGHIGMREASSAYARNRPGEDIFDLKLWDASLQVRADDLQKAVGAALDAVIEVIREIGSLGKPVHFHLHDGHPLSRGRNAFGISDHLSFLDGVEIPFEYKGKKSLDTMYGPPGLARIAREAITQLGAERVSFSLEIHPSGGRLSLGKDEALFAHWTDKTNAEKMNHWLSVLIENSRLLRKSL